MIGLVLFLQITASPPLSVREGVTQTTVPVTISAGVRSVPADALMKALGGSVITAAHGRFSLSLPKTRIELIEGIPFARIDSVTYGLARAPEVRAGKLFLPWQVVSELLPQHGGGIFYDAAQGELRTFSAPVARRNPPPRVADRSDPGPAPAAERSTRPPGRRLVVIDAGHGGPDRGMSGPIGDTPWFVEKDITLAVSRKLAEALRGSGMEVLMTRTKDTLIALSDRGRIANRNRGDLFVSIHVNAPGSSNAAGARERGYETYFLAEAKTDDAKRVERMENEAVKFETGANAPKGDPLSFIITDMAQNEHLRESNDLAQTIQDGLKEIHPGPGRGVHQANFAVLRGSYMPAVLVEIGFGSNQLEASYLSNSFNQDRIARNISESVLAYLENYESRVGGVR